MRKKRYYVTTWDTDAQAFTKQPGVRVGPYSLFGLRRALRLLRKHGYEGHRGDNSILVEDEISYQFERQP